MPELRPVTYHDIQEFKEYAGNLPARSNSRGVWVSISQVDIENGSPMIGDMIARNPENHDDQWLVAERYFKENFEPF